MLRVTRRMTNLINSNVRILSQLNSAQRTVANYINPHDIKSPLDYIVIYNRSKNAVNSAVTKLRLAWPDIKLIQVTPEDVDPVPGVDLSITNSSWSVSNNNGKVSVDNKLQAIQAQFENLVMLNPDLARSMASKKVGFYCAWSTDAENSDLAQQVAAYGFTWIGASPKSMEQLDKINFKKLCKKIGLPTADFIVVENPKNETDKEKILQEMAKNLVDLYGKTPELSGRPVFVKHNEGGGGRGTKKVSVMTYEDALQAIRKVVNETGGNFEGVYVELALDFDGALLFQLEIEGDANSLAEGGRLVWFNKENQKVLEIGFTDQEIIKLIPQHIYEQCREASKVIFTETGYNNRGTNEILIIKDKHHNWSFKLLELNKRIQVEHEALSELVIDKQGRARNVPAEQVMRALGYPAPKPSDFSKKGANIIAHIRLLSCEITTIGSRYPAGLVIDGAFYPQGLDVRYVNGEVDMHADPQIGRMLIPAQNMQELSTKILYAMQNFQFFGPNTEKSTYTGFICKLVSDSRFISGNLGCNQAFDVLKNPVIDKGKLQSVIQSLSYTVTPLIAHGYRRNEGVKNQPYPTRDQISEYKSFVRNLMKESIPKTSFSNFISHGSYDNYIDETKDNLAKRGGGTVTVIRDVVQESMDQESAAIQSISTRNAEVYLVRSGIVFGNEIGGAQYQAALMRSYNWLEVLKKGCPVNLPAHSLTRSKWLNGLSVKTLAEQSFYFNTIGREVANHYGISSTFTPYLPWMPYNFHAGNHVSQDITTTAMLNANLAVIPCWAWDPRYTKDDFIGWVKRQIKLFKELDKPLNFIRIKNPGQGPHWNEDVIVNMVQIIRRLFRYNHMEEPIIMIHNHDFNGLAAHIGAKAIKKCQEIGYRFLIVDSAPPGTTHNSNLIIANVLNLSAEEKDNLKHYNYGAHLMLRLNVRFNNENLTKIIKDPFSERAGGTNSSDLAGAVDMKIDMNDMHKAIKLGRELTGLGTEVTPYSEWIKQIGYAIWNNQNIQPKNLAAVIEYINNGGKLMVANNILLGLRDWETLLVQNDTVKKLLQNHEIPLNVDKTEENDTSFDENAIRAQLQSKLPNTLVGEQEICTYIGFDKIGQNYLERRDSGSADNTPRDITPLLDNPDIIHAEKVQKGDKFTIYGIPVTVRDVRRHNDIGKVEVDYLVLGQIVRTSCIDPDSQNNTNVKLTRYLKDKEHEAATPLAGRMCGFFVKKGDVVKKGQRIATVESMKMEIEVLAENDGEVNEIVANSGQNVDSNEVIITYK